MAANGCNTLKAPFMSFATLVATFLILCAPQRQVEATYNFISCGKCDEARCPELHYCEGQPIKDHCGCCTVCSSSKFQPHPMLAAKTGGNACDQVECPKLKVCVENMQGLPLCTCPSMFVCRRTKKREVCGTDGKTYPSRCHMRIASCNQGIAVRKKYKGECRKEDQEKDAEAYNRRIKRMKRRRRRRRKGKDRVGDVNEDRDKKRRKERRRRRRRKSGSRKKRGKSRMRRHRSKNYDAGRAFEEAFAHYTWKA